MKLDHIVTILLAILLFGAFVFFVILCPSDVEQKRKQEEYKQFKNGEGGHS